MTNDQRKWRFPSGGYGEVKGINDAGVETFNSNTLRSLVRESIQNSLDAATGETVRVEFRSFEYPTAAIPDYQGLQRNLSLCLTEGGDTSPTAKAFFKNALEVIGKKNLRVMMISDYWTTGLRGAKTGKTGSDWSRLVKESGSSNKTGTSGGELRHRQVLVICLL